MGTGVRLSEPCRGRYRAVDLQATVEGGELKGETIEGDVAVHATIAFVCDKELRPLQSIPVLDPYEGRILSPRSTYELLRTNSSV